MKEHKDTYLSIAYYYLGICFYKLNSYRKADISLSNAKYYRPKNIRIILQLAKVKEKLKEYENALEYFNDALKLNPNNIQALDGIKRLKTIQ